MSDLPRGRAGRLDQVLRQLLAESPELEAAAVVSFDGLPMASALPVGFDEDRVAAMSAALLSLGERAAEGLGRGDLSQVWIEGADGTVFLVSAEDEAVLVAVAGRGAKAGLMMYEVRRAAAAVAAVLCDDPNHAFDQAVSAQAAEPVVVVVPMPAELTAPRTLVAPQDGQRVESDPRGPAEQLVAGTYAAAFDAALDTFDTLDPETPLYEVTAPSATQWPQDGAGHTTDGYTTDGYTTLDPYAAPAAWSPPMAPPATDIAAGPLLMAAPAQPGETHRWASRPAPLPVTSHGQLDEARRLLDEATPHRTTPVQPRSWA